MKFEGNIATVVNKDVHDTAVTEFRLASRNTTRDADGNPADGEPTWFTVECWGKLGENVAKHANQGDYVMVTSHRNPKSRGWSNKDTGEIDSGMTIVADHVSGSWKFAPKTQ